MRWHRSLKNLFPLRNVEKRQRLTRRVLLQLEELETRALLSASSATPVHPLTAATTNEANQPPTTTDGAFPLLTAVHPKVSAQASPGVSGETPQQIQQIYGFDKLSNNGSGETIAIVDAFNDPNILSDANTFSSEFGLPLLNNTTGPSLTVVASGGGSASSLSQDPTGAWQLETSLDVEWAHAMAPGANILLVEAPDESNNSMFNAVKYAASQPGVVAVSMSWGINEFSGETAYDSDFSQPGVTFVAASGDYGAGAIYPAASPYVLSVGGTTLGGSTSSTGGGGTGGTGFGTVGFGTSGFGTSGLGTSGFGRSGGFGSSFFGTFASHGSGYSVYPRLGGGLYSGTGALTVTPSASPPGGSSPGSYPGETAWYGSGGGPSAYEGYPSYQFNQPWIASNYGYPNNVAVTNYFTGTTNDYSARMTPDVAYNADPNTGYAVYDSTASADYGTVAGWNVVGGTSAAAPQWAAIVALADQQRAAGGEASLSTSDVLNALYNTLGLSPTNSTYTSVFNDITTGSNGYATGPGYDLATGLGTPIVNNLVPLLSSAPSGTTFTVIGSGYGGSGSSGFGGGTGGFSSGTYFGFSATNQPGGGLFAGSGSLSIPPGSPNVNGMNGPASGATFAPTTPQANALPAISINSVSFSLPTTAAATVSTAANTSNLVGNIATLAPEAPSATMAGSVPMAALTSAPSAQTNGVFGASGWNGADLSWRLSSLGLPSPQTEQSADDSSENLEDINDRSADDVLLADGDSSGEDVSALDLIAPAQQEDGDTGDSGDGGDG